MRAPVTYADGQLQYIYCKCSSASRGKTTVHSSRLGVLHAHCFFSTAGPLDGSMNINELLLYPEEKSPSIKLEDASYTLSDDDEWWEEEEEAKKSKGKGKLEDSPIPSPRPIEFPKLPYNPRDYEEELKAKLQ